MAHISAGVEYALHCLVYLVDPVRLNRSGSARDLAELQGLSVEYVAKLFTKLQKAGIVTAAEGVHGGFSLARSPDQISFLDVVDAIDGYKPMFDCKNVRTDCALFDGTPPEWATRGVCAIHAVMIDAEAHARQVLATQSLADVASRLSAKASHDFDNAVGAWLVERVTNRSARSPRSGKIS